MFTTNTLNKAKKKVLEVTEEMNNKQVLLLAKMFFEDNSENSSLLFNLVASVCEKRGLIEKLNDLIPANKLSFNQCITYPKGV